MTDQMDIKKLTSDETKGLEEAKLEEISDTELATLSLPSGCSTGHGKCVDGRCYVCCKGKWYRLVDGNGNHYSCGEGRKKFYECGGETYAATC